MKRKIIRLFGRIYYVRPVVMLLTVIVIFAPIMSVYASMVSADTVSHIEVQPVPEMEETGTIEEIVPTDSPAQTEYPKTNAEFIEYVGRIAQNNCSDVLSSLVIAQAILESNWGRSGLSTTGNALFGIKAGSSWAGKTYSANTQECYNGTYTTIKGTFRAYNNWEESVIDHTKLLTGLSRYSGVVGERDYITACRAIQKAGYATDPQYDNKLIQLIEKYNLTMYD